MDLLELSDSKTRHPWETSRLKALKGILSDTLDNANDMDVLDLGCGDGYASREVFRGRKVKTLTALDINLTESQMARFGAESEGVTYINSYDHLVGRRFGLILALDIVEHQENDDEFLRGVVDMYLADGGGILFTAPAFQLLFGPHDRFLKHFRRYTLGELEALARHNRLDVLSSGYLFFSLLIPRFVKNAVHRIIGSTGFSAKGVEGWREGRVLTGTIDLLLRMDNAILMAFNRLGIKLPGLTAWALCEKRR